MSINEFERANLLERQREGVVIAKRRGKFKGRRAIVYTEKWEGIYLKWKNRELTATKAMELLNLK